MHQSIIRAYISWFTSNLKFRQINYKFQFYYSLILSLNIYLSCISISIIIWAFIFPFRYTFHHIFILRTHSKLQLGLFLTTQDKTGGSLFRAKFQIFPLHFSISSIFHQKHCPYPSDYFQVVFSLIFSQNLPKSPCRVHPPPAPTCI